MDTCKQYTVHRYIRYRRRDGQTEELVMNGDWESYRL